MKHQTKLSNQPLTQPINYLLIYQCNIPIFINYQLSYMQVVASSKIDQSSYMRCFIPKNRHNLIYKHSSLVRRYKWLLNHLVQLSLTLFFDLYSLMFLCYSIKHFGTFKTSYATRVAKFLVCDWGSIWHIQNILCKLKSS